MVGDASIANGMAFEALNHLGTTQANVLVILNDNTMGIDPSVGALKHYFETVKKEQPDTPNFFKSLNLEYSGPIDGHNMKELLQLFRPIKRKYKAQELFTLVTTKGKGLPIAENEQVTYHAPGKFEPLTGKLSPSASTSKIKISRCLWSNTTPLSKNK